MNKVDGKVDGDAQGDPDALDNTDDVVTGNGDAGTPGSNLGADTDAPEGDDTESPNKEAAKYRVRLREAETERDRLAGVVENLQRSAIEGLVAGAVPMKALWACVEMADLLSDDGGVDADKVSAAIGTVREEFDLGPRTPEPNPHLGSYGGDDGGPDPDHEFVRAFSPR